MSLSQENPNVEVPIIKQEMLDSEEITKTSEPMLGYVKQEVLGILQEKADCKISDVLISKPDGVLKREPLFSVETVHEPEKANSNELNEPTKSSKKVDKSCNSLVCTQCSYVASKKHGLLMHQVRVHQNRTDRVKVKCEHCEFMIYKDRYKAHLRSHAVPKLKCPKCSFTGSKDQMKKHKFRKHKKSYSVHNGYFCAICHLRFHKQSLLQTHKARHQNVTEFCCKICNCYFEHSWALERHTRLSCNKSVEQNLQCRFCELKFFTEQYLNHHERKKHFRIMTAEEIAKPVLELTCKCGKSFATPSRLATHKFSVHNASKRCTICHRMFKNLKSHMVSCKKRKPHNEKTASANENVRESFYCNLCNKQFATKYGRDKHQRKEICLDSINAGSGELKFECQLCKRAFRSKYWRDLHVKEVMCETKKKVHSCELCQTIFSTKTNFLKHKKSVHGCNLPPPDLQSDPCPGCNEKFESKVFLRRHMKYCVLL